MAWTLASACGPNKKDDRTSRTNEQILAEISTIKAIGKVIPASEWAVIASPVASRVQTVHVQEGDRVRKGEPLIVLEPHHVPLEIQEAEFRLQAFQAEERTTEEELGKARLEADQLKNTYRTSRRLMTQGAETREQTDADSSAWQQAEREVRSLEQRFVARHAQTEEQRIQLRKTRDELAQYQINAPQSGVIIDLNVKIGQSISSSDQLGRIVDTVDPAVEAEVDELFANDVRVGQAVFLLAVSRPDTLAQGHITWVSAVLSEKSILYETANEGQDRRVRKIRVQPVNDGTASPLTINSKVECQIKIK